MLSRNVLKSFRGMNLAATQRGFAGDNGMPAKRVLVSGAAGQIAYSIVYRIAR
jgi:hypothetical protein